MAMGPRSSRSRSTPALALALWAAAGHVASVAGAQTGAHAGAGADWPRWRGVQGDGVSPETDWNVVGRAGSAWEGQVGRGHSSCAVVGDAVYTLGFDIGRGEDDLVCLEAATGAVRWRASWPGELRDNSHDGGTLSTPTVTGGVVYVASNVGRIGAYDASTGAALWSVLASDAFGLTPPTWGFAASPLVLEVGAGARQVVLNLGAVVALDAATGALRWRTARHYGSAYSTPAVLESGGVTHLAVLCGEGLALVRSPDGVEVAFHAWDKAPKVAPMTPVIVDQRIFISGGYERGCALLEFTEGALREVWSSRAMRNKMSGCVLVGEHLYGFDEAILKCLDLDGHVDWAHRGLGTGALSVAGGRLVILDGHGQLVIALATPTGYTELSRRPVFDEGTFWSTPALSHGRVYCRNSLGRLVCLDLRTGPERASAEGRAALERLRAALPDANALFAAHSASVAKEGAPRPSAVRLLGRGRSVRNTARDGVVEVLWAEGRGFKWRELAESTSVTREDVAHGVMPSAGLELGIEVVGTGARGWIVGAREIAEPLQGAALEALQEASDVARLLDPSPWYPRRMVTGVTLFDHRPCYVVTAATRSGQPRTLYFEADSGRLAGQEGSGLDLWTYSAYRAIGGVTLPTRWAFYDADTGEMTSVTLTELDLAPAAAELDFTPPPVAALLLRSGADVAAEDARLRVLHATLLGDWIADDDPPDGPRRKFWIADGFLQTDRPRPEANRWRGPDERGRFVLIGSEYLTFALERTADGRVSALQVYVDDQPRTRLVRPPESPAPGTDGGDSER